MISTHILDTARGMPATGVEVILEKRVDSHTWFKVGLEVTNPDGRIMFECPKETGVYKLTFKIEKYFVGHGQDFFFMDTPIIFQVKTTDRKYHVPLLLNPFGISSYRGS